VSTQPPKDGPFGSQKNGINKFLLSHDSGSQRPQSFTRKIDGLSAKAWARQEVEDKIRHWINHEEARLFQCQEDTSYLHSQCSWRDCHGFQSPITLLEKGMVQRVGEKLCWLCKFEGHTNEDCETKRLFELQRNHLYRPWFWWSTMVFTLPFDGREDFEIYTSGISTKIIVTQLVFLHALYSIPTGQDSRPCYLGLFNSCCGSIRIV
jgi:hypothetical protein